MPCLVQKVVKSNHPLFSVAGLGKNPEKYAKIIQHIITDISPYYKMMDIKTKFYVLEEILAEIHSYILLNTLLSSLPLQQNF